jgi:hypothetical protein
LTWLNAAGWKGSIVPVTDDGYDQRQCCSGINMAANAIGKGLGTGRPGIPAWAPPLAIVMIVAFQVLALAALGQPGWCECGYVKLWHGLVLSPENSQHLTDWYTFSHVIHGSVFYLLLWLVAPSMPFGLRLALALGLEAAWEVFENTPFVIDRYRQSALAQGYFGDSVINSVTDTLAAGVGVVLARTLPIWAMLVLVVFLELFVGAMIRDNLILNIVQLIYPNDFVSRWQSGL